MLISECRTYLNPLILKDCIFCPPQGTIQERGIAVWQNVDSPETSLYVETYKVYEPWMPEWLRQSRIIRYLPFLPNPEEGDIPRTLTSELKDIGQR